MRALLRILSLFQVVICVDMGSESENAFTGTEGGSVDIYCKYPDGYQYIYKYFCRDPCGYYDVLIKTENADKVTSKDRYSILNTVSARSFSVSIKNLRLEDSGVYHCGVDSWGKDILSRVELTVRKVPPKPTASPLSTPQTSKSTDLSSTSTVRHITAGLYPPDDSTTHEQASSSTHPSVLIGNSTTSPTTQSTSAFIHHELPVYGGLLGLLLFCFLVALVVLYRRRSSTQSTSLNTSALVNQASDAPPDQEEVSHYYDEILADGSLAGPANSQNFSIIQYSHSTEEGGSPYCLLAPH